MLYFIIVFIATLIGGISGMGGGVIIKPSLDAMAQVDLASIGVLSSITVLTMSIVSVAKGLRGKLNVDKQLIILALSGLVGGFLGNYLFAYAGAILDDSGVNTLQIVLNLTLLMFCIFGSFIKPKQVQNIFAYVIVGILLGGLATFIGIGGGPINIALLTLVFGFDIKKAVTSSLFIIMFSQTMNVVTVWVNTSFVGYDLEPLIYMIPAAIIGGFLGSVLCKRMSEKFVKTVYTVVVVGLVGLNVFNLINV